MTEPGCRPHVDIVGEEDDLIIHGPAWGPASDYLRLTLCALLANPQRVVMEPRGHHPWVEERDRFRCVLRDFLDRLPE